MPRRIALFGRLALAFGLLCSSSGVARAQDAPSVHTVEAGETLSQIALDLAVDADAMAALNGLDDANALQIGQTLKIPTKRSSPAQAAAPASTTYTIADGDTLWDIALKFSTSVGSLMDLNHLDDTSILAVGAQLTVPGAARASATPVVSTPKPTATSTPAPRANTASASAGKRTLLVPYTVQPGETLNQIARQFDIRPDAIIQATALDDPNRIAVGSVLKVPLPGHEHVVVEGETLRDIALQEKVDLGSLIDFNDMADPELIRVGQVVVIPPAGGQSAATAPARTNSDAPPPPPVPPAPAPQAAAPAPAPQNPAPAPAASAAAPQNPAPAPAASTPKPTPAPTPKPTAAPKPPAVVATPPKDAPKDGLAGAALKLLGAPYVWGGSSPSGFDCSGFIWYVAKQIGRPVSRGMLGEYNSGSHPSKDELKPGDLVFFQNTYTPGLSHNGIYLGGGQFVHAADEAAGVTISSLNTAYWSSHWFGATRLP